MPPYSQRAVLLLYAVTGALLYGRTLGYPMVFDDLLYLAENPLFKEFHHFWELLTQFSEKVVCLAPLGKDGDVSANFALRPVTYFSFFLNHQIGGLNPAGYRVVNILLHTANAFLTFRISRCLLRSPYFSRSTQGANQELAPITAGLLFLIHPLQIESVTYIIQRATSLCTLFYLVAILLHLEATQTRSTSLRALSSLSAVGCMLSKESGFTAPFVALSLEWLLFRVPIRTAIKNAAGLLVWIPLVPAMLIAVSMSQKGGLGLSDLLHVSATQGSTSQSLPYALTQPSVWIGYLRLFLWPSGLNLDPDLSSVRSASQREFWLPFLTLLTGPVMALVALRKRFACDVAVSLLCGMGWFALTIAPDSSFVPLPDLMAEHRTYIPLVGMCFFTGVILSKLAEQRATLSIQRYGILVLLLPTTALCLSTLHRNEFWSSKEKLWRDTCTKSPRKLRPWINLANAYIDLDELEQAKWAIEQSIAVQPTGVAYANLSSILLRMQRREQALEAALKGLECPSSGYDFFVLAAVGRCHANLERWTDAMPFLEKALESSHGHLESAHLLAVAQSNLGRHREALQTLQSAQKYHPTAQRIISGIAFCEAKLREHAFSMPLEQSLRNSRSEQQALEPYRLRLGF